MLLVDEFKLLFWTIPRHRLRALFRRQDMESELNEELDYYISLRTDRLVAQGLSPAQASDEAARELGGIEQIKEECRDVWGVRLIEEFWQDTRYAIRTLRKTPSFAFGAVALLTLAVASNVMVASLFSALFLSPVPYKDPQQLVGLSQEFATLKPDGLAVPFSLQEVIDLQRQVSSLGQMAMFHRNVFNATGDRETERVLGVTVSRNLFAVLGAGPISGHVFDSDNPLRSKADGVVVSERLWRRLYASDGTLVGKQIQLNGRLRTVLGIMPADFEFPLPQFNGFGAGPGRADIWEPMVPARAEIDDRGLRAYSVVGRLKTGARVRELNRELEKVASNWKGHYGSIYQSSDLHLNAFPLQRRIVPRLKSAASILAIAVLLVWLISVANLIAMLLARAATARQQMAIRMALGGAPKRLLRQAMSEGVLLSVFGSTLGILVGSMGLVFLRATSANSSSLLAHLHMNANVVIAAFALFLITVLLLGLVPASYAVRHATADALKHGRGGSTVHLGSHLLRDRLVIAETALALVLLVGAGLLTKSLLRLQHVYPGFKAAGVVTMEFSLPEGRYPESAAVADRFSTMARDVARLAGMSSVAFVSHLPFGGLTTDGSFTIEGDMERSQPPDEELRIITPDYFRVLKIPLLRGRSFASSDSSRSQPVAIVNQALARRYWGTDNIVGKRIKLDYPRDVEWRTVVGVVGNIRHKALDAPIEPELYLPHTQQLSRRMFMVVRTNRDVGEASAMIRQTVQSIDSQQPIASSLTLGRAITDSVLPRTIATALLGVFAVIGLLLAVTGIYAVICYTTLERRHEIALRMAIGANRRDVIAMVLKQSGALLLAGAIIGIAIVAGASFILRPMLYEVSTFDPVMLLSMLGFLITCGLIAAYIPARRATRHNLASALAHD